MTDKMKNLAIRSVSGLILGAVMLGAILWSPWSLGTLLLAILAGGMCEFYALAAGQGAAPQRALGLTTGTVLFFFAFALATPDLAATAREYGVALLSFGLLLGFTVFICALFRPSGHPAADIATTLTGVIYVALPFSLIVLFPTFGADGWNPWIVVAYVFIIWANDVFAYFTGMMFGRRKLCERLSPKKTWEGFAGGVAGAVATGVAAGYLLGGSPAAWGGLALVAAVTAVAGDLAESMFKRAAGVKDSGSLIPGHGGVLDRFDAMLISAPFVFVYLLLVM